MIADITPCQLTSVIPAETLQRLTLRFSVLRCQTPWLTINHHAMSASLNPPLCRICKSHEYRTRDCPQVDSDDESFVMTCSAEMEQDAGDKLNRARKDAPKTGDRAERAKNQKPPTKTKAAPTMETPGSSSTAVPEFTGLTEEEAQFISRRREKQRASKAKAQGGESTDRAEGRLPFVQQHVELRVGPQHRSLDGQPREDVVLEEARLDDPRQEGSRAGGRSEVEEESTLAGAAAGARGGHSLRALRVDEAEAASARNDTPHVKLRHLNRGDVQKMKAGVRSALGVLEVFERARLEDGKWLVLEVFAGKARLTTRARENPCWKARCDLWLGFAEGRQAQGTPRLGGRTW